MLQLRQFFLLFVLVVIDQTTKWIAELSMVFFKPIHIIPNIFSLELVHNYGAAYGILQNQRLFLLSVSVIVIVGAFYFSKHIIQSVYSLYALVFLLAGAIGNFIDRLFLGYVIDFVDIKIFPVFNFADVFIDIAIILFLAEIIIYDRKKTSR